MEFSVSGPGSPFLGGVILSLSPQLQVWYGELPPILTDFVVLGVGFTQTEYVSVMPTRSIPAGMALYAQGLAADGIGLYASAVQKVVISDTPN